MCNSCDRCGIGLIIELHVIGAIDLQVNKPRRGDGDLQVHIALTGVIAAMRPFCTSITTSCSGALELPS